MCLLALSDVMRGRFRLRMGELKIEFLLIEDEWRALAREIADIEQSRQFVADAEISTRQR